MDPSEQVLNEQERLAVAGLAPVKSLPEVQEFTQEPGGNLHKEHIRLKSDYKKLLISYNELSMAFRAHVSHNHNEFLIQIISDLKSDKEKLINQNKFYLENLFASLVENQKIKTKSEVIGENGLDFASVEELIFQNLYLKDVIQIEENEKIKELEEKVKKVEEVRISQGKLIEELKNELSVMQKYPSEVYMNVNNIGESLKVKEAMVDELRKENKALKRDILTSRAKERKDNEEMFRLRNEVIQLENSLSGAVKLVELLQGENLQLAGVNAGLVEIEVNNVLRFSEGKVANELKSISSENIEVQRKNFMLSLEVQKLQCELLENSENLKKIGNDQEKTLFLDGKKNAELERLKKEIEKLSQINEELKGEFGNLSKEIVETSKILKRTKDELESVKKVTSKRVSQLESALQSKSLETTVLSSPLHLQKLVALLHKSLS